VVGGNVQIHVPAMASAMKAMYRSTYAAMLVLSLMSVNGCPTPEMRLIAYLDCKEEERRRQSQGGKGAELRRLGDRNRNRGIQGYIGLGLERGVIENGKFELMLGGLRLGLGLGLLGLA
jgi:hypothetical protein